MRVCEARPGPSNQASVSLTAVSRSAIRWSLRCVVDIASSKGQGNRMKEIGNRGSGAVAVRAIYFLFSLSYFLTPHPVRLRANAIRGAARPATKSEDAMKLG